LAEVDAQAYAVTSANAAAGASNSIETQQPGGSGALRQAMVIGDPTTRGNIAGVNSSGGLQIAGTQPATTTASWTSATTLNTAASVAVNGYNTVSVAMSNTSTMTAGVLTFEVSPDSGTTWFPIAMARIDSFTTETTYTLNTVANRAWSTSVDGFTNFRVRLSTVITGTGTASLFIIPQTFAIEPIVQVGQTTAANLQAQVAQSGTWTVQPGNTQNTTNHLVAPGADANAKSTTSYLATAQLATVTAMKASAGKLYALNIYNPNTSIVYLQMWDLATASVTLGTTTPKKTFAIPAGGWLDTQWVIPIGFATAISHAATTTATGLTAPTTGLLINAEYI
jgi:hypothetical protein